MKKVKITQHKSAIGQKVCHKRTLIALGIKKLNQTVEHTLTPSIEGMIQSLHHLVRVENA